MRPPVFARPTDVVKTALSHLYDKRVFFALKNAPKRRFSDSGRLRIRKNQKNRRNPHKTIEKISFICYNIYIWGNIAFSKISLVFDGDILSIFGSNIHKMLAVRVPVQHGRRRRGDGKTPRRPQRNQITRNTHIF